LATEVRTYPYLVQPPVAAKRLAYRSAYRALQLSWLLRRPAVSGVKCLLVNRDRILLVRHTYGHRGWDLPGGAMKRHELPLTAARREMAEELGVDCDRWTSLGAVEGTVDHRRDTIHVFRVDLETPAITMDLGELAAASWFDSSNLPPNVGPYVLPIVNLAAAPGAGITAVSDEDRR
jgi:8-oxo-dGTP pyrophosphatase MutT (NUDIX family)